MHGRGEVEVSQKEEVVYDQECLASEFRNMSAFLAILTELSGSSMATVDRVV